MGFKIANYVLLRNTQFVPDFYTSMNTYNMMITHRWDKVFKSGPSKICGRQPLKNLKGCGLLKQI